MTAPDIGAGDGVSAQLLLKISNDVSGLVTDVAVIKEQTRQLSDHEQRIRDLRSEVPPKLTDRLGALESEQAKERGGRDLVARLLAAGGALAAGAAAAAAWAANAHHH